MNKNSKYWLNMTLTRFAAAALCILLFFAIYRMDNILSALEVMLNSIMPVIYGGAMAYMLKPICNFWEKRLGRLINKDGTVGKAKLAKGLSILITMVLAIVVVGGLLTMVIPSLLTSIYSVILLIPDSARSLSNWLLQYIGDNEVLSDYVRELTENISESIPDWLSNTLLPNLETMIGSITGMLSNVFEICKNLIIGIIVAIYLLSYRKTLAEQGKKIVNSIFNEKWSNIILDEFRYADKMFSGFINGRLVDSLIVGIICFIGMLAMDMPYKVLISVIVGVTNIIPFFGPYIGAIPSFFLVLMVSPVKSIVFVIFILILQQFDGNILGPRILGNVTGLSSFWVLFSILLFGGVFGFIGMIIGVPLFAVIYDIVRRLVSWGLARRQAEKQEEGSQQ